jgi:hypothetical protein
MRAFGFTRVEFERMTLGAVALHLGYIAETGCSPEPSIPGL